MVDYRRQLEIEAYKTVTLLKVVLPYYQAARPHDANIELTIEVAEEWMVGKTERVAETQDKVWRESFKQVNVADEDQHANIIAHAAAYLTDALRTYESDDSQKVKLQAIFESRLASSEVSRILGILVRSHKLWGNRVVRV